MRPRSRQPEQMEITLRVPDVDLAPTMGGRSAPAPPPEGLSPFSARVLDQLSLTAWLPAALLVANLYVVIGMYFVRDPAAEPTIDNLKEVVASLDSRPVGVILAAVFGIVLVTLITQSLEFAAIRFLEGYWGGSMLAALPTWSGIRVQLLRLRLMDRRAKKIESKAFRAAEPRIRRDLRKSPEVLSATLLLGAGKDVTHVAADVREAAERYVDSMRWLRWAPAHMRHRANSIYNRRSAFPRLRSRMLPTRLGNALRSAEDQLRGDAAGPKMRGYLYEHLDRVGATLMHQHNQYRNRMDMYAVMTAVSLCLALVDAWLLPPVLPKELAFAVSASFVALSYLSYRGAVSAALDYGPILLAMDRIITPASEPRGSGKA